MSLNCNEVRLRLPLREEELESGVEEHLLECRDCRQLARWHQHFDALVGAELVTAAPAEVTSCLLAIVPALASGSPVRTRRWYRQRTLAALIASVLVSLSVLLLALGLNWLSQLIGAEQMMATVASWPGLAIASLYKWLPQSQYVVEAILSLREPLQWLIIALLLWRAFERIRPSQELSSPSL